MNSSPIATCEHPAEALGTYRREGVTQLICEEKHMGSRAVVVVCRDESVAVRRFGSTASASAGAIYTRTGRTFFSDPALEVQILDQARATIESLDLWQELETDWMVLDCELLPWSAKALEIVQEGRCGCGEQVDDQAREGW